MSSPTDELELDGVVRASRYNSALTGKCFLGAMLECSDGTRWILSYSEQSPYHVFGDRRVQVLGMPRQPTSGQILISLDKTRPIKHFSSVSTVRLLEDMPDAAFVEVGEAEELTGRFERPIGEDAPRQPLFFVTENDARLLVVNDPAGLRFGHRVQVHACPVRQSASVSASSLPCFWIEAPASALDIWEWRRRHGYAP